MLKKLLAIGVLAVALVGCGKEKKKQVVIEPAYMPYYQELGAMATRVGTGLGVEDLAIISVDHMDNPRVLAVCEIPPVDDNNPDSRPTIKVGPAWKDLSEDFRLALLFHELMHCAHGAAHDPTVFRNGNPTTVMNPYLIRTFEGDWKLWYVAKALGADASSLPSPADSLIPPSALIHR